MSAGSGWHLHIRLLRWAKFRNGPCSGLWAGPPPPLRLIDGLQGALGAPPAHTPNLESELFSKDGRQQLLVLASVDPVDLVCLLWRGGLGRGGVGERWDDRGDGVVVVVGSSGSRVMEWRAGVGWVGE